MAVFLEYEDRRVLAREVTMKKTFLIFLLMFLGIPQAASAKSPTVKIMISGGGLTSTIEATDPRILDISNVWSGQFLDHSRGTAKEPRRGLQRYEVSFYVKIADNEVRKKYVLYYYPNSEAEPGYIYLPGKGETWYSLNVGTIIRQEQDGKWNYASPAWEDLIKSVIASAEVTQHQRSCTDEAFQSSNS
jgi:hypothetical protein